MQTYDKLLSTSRPMITDSMVDDNSIQQQDTYRLGESTPLDYHYQMPANGFGIKDGASLNVPAMNNNFSSRGANKIETKIRLEKSQQKFLNEHHGVLLTERQTKAGENEQSYADDLDKHMLATGRNQELTPHGSTMLANNHDIEGESRTSTKRLLAMSCIRNNNNYQIESARRQSNNDKFGVYAPRIELNKIVKARKIMRDQLAQKMNSTDSIEKKIKPNSMSSNKKANSRQTATTLRDGFRLPLLDCEALEREAKKRTSSRLESEGPTVASLRNSPARPDGQLSQVCSSAGEEESVRV